MLIDRYVLKSFAGPFVLSLATVIFIFLFQFLIKSLDQFVGKGLSSWIIIQLIALNLAWMLTLAVPMAMLVASLMAFGSLSSTNEITVMKSGGISLVRLMIPMILLSFVMFYLMIRFNNDVLPEANHKARILLYDISKTKPTFILEPGKFSGDIQGAQILVRKTFPNSNEIEGVYVLDYSNAEFRNMLTAEKGNISFSTDFKNVIMDLENGEIHQLSNIDPSRNYRRIKFEKHRLLFKSQGFGFNQSSESAFSRGDRELSAQAMKKVVDSLQTVSDSIPVKFNETILKDLRTLTSLNYRDTSFTLIKADTQEQKPRLVSNRTFPVDTVRKLAVPGNLRDSISMLVRSVFSRNNDLKNFAVSRQQVDKMIDSYDVEIFKKYSIPFACVVFVLVGAPLGYRVKRGGFGIAAGLSLLFFLLYWISLIGGEKLADRGIVTPFAGMWIANIIIGVFGIYLMFKSS
jgi:lipopolysaccharide export system permease protein